MKIELIKTQKVLSPTQISLADYVINPYRGCEFNCLYCYAHLNKNNSDRQTLGVKINAAECLERELKYKTPHRILLGSTTECFQYQELNYKITEKILCILNSQKIPYTILTKSHLIRKFLPLITRNKANKIYFTLNCASDKIITLFEEKSPSLAARLETIEEIIEQKIDLRIHIGPYIPYLSSLEDIFKIIPSGVEEIDIEVYHHKMGNFPEILNQIEKNINFDLRKKINTVYENSKNYYAFGETLKKDIKNLCARRKDKFKIFYILPDFDKFYSPRVDYENTLI